MNFEKGYFPEISEKDFPEVQRLHKEALFNLMRSEQLTAGNLIGTLKDAVIDTYNIFKQVLYDIKLPENLWDRYTYKGEEFYLEPLTAGLTDGVIEEVKSVPLLVSIVVDLFTDTETQNLILGSITSFSASEIYDKFVDTRSELYTSPNIDRIKHQTGKDIVATGTMLGTGGIASLGKIKKGTEFFKELAQNAKKNLPSLIRKLKSRPAYLSNRIIWSQANKTTTVIGRWQDELENLFKELGESDLNIYTLSGKFDNPEGFNILSIEDFKKVAEEVVKKGIKADTKAFDDYIWKKFNEPWLESALQRGDDIVLWSDPNNLNNLFKPFIDMPSGPTFFNREVKFLKGNAKKFGYDDKKEFLMVL